MYKIYIYKYTYIYYINILYKYTYILKSFPLFIDICIILHIKMLYKLISKDFFKYLVTSDLHFKSILLLLKKYVSINRHNNHIK